MAFFPLKRFLSGPAECLPEDKTTGYAKFCAMASGWEKQVQIGFVGQRMARIKKSANFANKRECFFCSFLECVSFMKGHEFLN